jgi:putative salt-induced outer membrane protein YdiY
MKFILRAGTLAALTLTIAWADQVTLRNGDRISGAIVKKDAKTLTIKNESMGTIVVPWDQVESIRSDAPLNIVLQDRTVQATLDGKDGKIQLREQQQTVEAANVVAIRDADEQRKYERLLNPGLADLWAGTATLGFAGTQGNAQTKTLTVALNAARLTNADKTSIYFNVIKASALLNGVKADTAQAIRGGWAYNHDVSPRLFVSAFNDYEYDRFQNLDLRFVLGGGLGYTAWKAERGRLDLLAGLAYNREKFSPAAPSSAFTRNSAEAFWGNSYMLQLNSATTLLQSFRMFHNLSDTGAYRINADVAADTKLTRWLTWTVALSDRYLSNPVPGRKTNDFLYTTGLGFTFAR